MPDPKTDQIDPVDDDKEEISPLFDDDEDFGQALSESFGDLSPMSPSESQVEDELGAGSGPEAGPLITAPKTKNPNDEMMGDEAEDMLGQLDQTVDQPVDQAADMGSDTVVEASDTAADMETEAGDAARGAFRTAADVPGEMGAAQSQALKDSADDAEARADELSKKTNKSAYEDGLEAGYQDSANLQRTISKGMDTGLEAYGRGVANVDASMGAMTEMSSSATKQAGSSDKEITNELEDLSHSGQNMGNKAIGSALDTAQNDTKDIAPTTPETPKPK